VRFTRVVIVLAVCLAGTALLGGCGADEPESAAPSPAEARKQLAGSPPPLAALHDQASELLDGGQSAYDKRLQQLRGFPVVVNKWASWCAPCRAEFPYFQKLGVKYGKRVAFLGLNSADNRDAAQRFLDEYPVTFPSYVDPKEQIARELKLTAGFPMTLFYDRNGKVVEKHIGGYSTEAKLEEDIKTALGAS
jgi:cytochrome c biogenesis protein CcmG/thiol:disulfide interchange protein DsbE